MNCDKIYFLFFLIPTSSLSSSSCTPCYVCPLSFVLIIDSFSKPLTVVLNSTVLHKSPLYLATCADRFYNPLLRQW